MFLHFELLQIVFTFLSSRPNLTPLAPPLDQQPKLALVGLFALLTLIVLIVLLLL